jgi:hypothetical protein
MADAPFTVTISSTAENSSTVGFTFTATTDAVVTANAPFTMNITNPNAGVWVMRGGFYHKVDVYVRRSGVWKQL